MINKKGFSLLELTLVLGVGTMMAFMKFQDMRNEQESVLASTVGQQMKQMGEAVNGYINIRYDKLSILSNAAGNGTDPGPRTCSSSVCTITYQTLINEGLLPASYTGINALKSSYKIVLKRSGISPNYVINGLITTTSPWGEGGKYRYDLLGKAMQLAGIDSGMTKTTSNVFGYGGQWSENSVDFNNITIPGQLAYRVGYDSSMYSVYLRRDGTLPMTGDLNMGGKNIANISNITASGEIITERLKTKGDANIYGKFIADKDATVHGLLYVKGNVISSSDVSGEDIYAHNKMYTKSLYSSGGISAGSVLSMGGIGASGTIYTSGNIMATKDISSSGNITANGDISAYGNVKSSGRITVGEFIKVNGISSAGSACQENGLFSRERDGSILSCVNGVWKKGASLTRGECYWTGNHSGRDFTPKMCNVGEYIAGFKFNGHQNRESAYTVACCSL